MRKIILQYIDDGKDSYGHVTPKTVKIELDSEIGFETLTEEFGYFAKAIGFHDKTIERWLYGEEPDDE